MQAFASKEDQEPCLKELMYIPDREGTGPQSTFAEMMTLSKAAARQILCVN